MIPAETLRELTQLRDRVAYLEERERLFFGQREHAIINIRSVWPDVTVGMARMLFALSRGTVLTREQLSALCGHDDDADARLVDSQIKRIRKRVPGIVVISHYGLGYELHEPWVGRIRAAATGGGRSAW